MSAAELERIRRRFQKARRDTAAKCWAEKPQAKQRQYLAGVVEGIDYALRVLKRHGFAKVPTKG